MTDLPAIRELRDDLVRRLADHAGGGNAVPEWYPNEAYMQRYAPSALGVSPHVDSSRFAYLIAVFTTEGSARFAVCRDRSGDPLMEWNAGPGSLVLLRGSSSKCSDRPFHTVGSPAVGRRFSVTLRMSTRPG
jgi:alkylated DNA repair dioxygenase AlkB